MTAKGTHRAFTISSHPPSAGPANDVFSSTSGTDPFGGYDASNEPRGCGAIKPYAVGASVFSAACECVSASF